MHMRQRMSKRNQSAVSAARRVGAMALVLGLGAAFSMVRAGDSAPPRGMQEPSAGADASMPDQGRQSTREGVATPSVPLVASVEASTPRGPVRIQRLDDSAQTLLAADATDVAIKLANGRPNAKSVLVWLDPAVDRPADNRPARQVAAPSAARVNVRQFALQRGAFVKHEYEILPNVLNLRGVTDADVAALRGMPGVVRVEEDEVYHISLHDSMSLIRGLESQKSAAGLSARGAGVRVCIIDSGINAAHSMFAGRIDAAADFDHFNNDPDPADDNGHGSNVAGIAAGSDGFSVNFGTCGVEPFQGVAPSATIIAMKVCSASGSCPTSDIVAGINDCASPSLPGGPADVINLSLGGGQFSGTCDAELSAAAANAAVAAGVTVVAAAGNNGFANALGSPACGSQVIAVGAVYDSNFPNCQDADTSFGWCLNSFCTSTCTDSAPVNVDERVCFSNRSVNLELTAPGALIWSAGSTGTNSIIEQAGTSQASPHVAGLAALILGLDPSLTPAQVLQLMRDGAVDLGAAGFDNDFGWGRIDVINTLNLMSAGCTSNPECDDGLACNGVETCDVPSGNCQAGTPVNCNDGVACTTDACNEPSGTCSHTPNNGACSDGLFCNGTETCNVTLGCQAGTAPNCADSVACTTDSCNESTDTCDHIANNAACDDGLFCNGAETCNVTLGCQAGSDPCGGAACDEGTDTCAGSEVWMSFISATTVPVVGTAADEDIVAYNTSSGTWSLVFDGSDVGLSGFVIDGLARLSTGDILLSFTVSGSVAGMTGGPSGTTLDDSDIVRFVPTSLGANTAGSFVFYFDGSDVGLTTDNEDVDAIALDAAGKLVISTLGGFTATGASGDDEDLIVFTATSLGSVTSGSFAMYFDGSDVSLTATAEDVDAAAIVPTGEILLSTEGNFSVPGASGADEDVFEFTPTTLGGSTSGVYAPFLDLSTLGISTAADVGGVEWVP